MESLIISDAFHAMPTIDLCQDCAEGAVIERRANKVHTLSHVINAIAPSLHNLGAGSGKIDDQYKWSENGVATRITEGWSDDSEEGGLRGKVTDVDFTTRGPSTVGAVHWEHPNGWPQPVAGGGHEGQGRILTR